MLGKLPLGGPMLRVIKLGLNIELACPLMYGFEEIPGGYFGGSSGPPPP